MTTTLAPRQQQRIPADSAVTDVAYRTVDTPIGPILVAATGKGVVRLAFDLEDFGEVLTELTVTVAPDVVERPARLDDAARELDEYFARTRRRFEVPIDWTLSRGLRRTVRERMVEIPYGETSSYTELAAAAGSPRAVRAVGTACATNPIPLLIPCHRVVRSDGSLGGYRGGLEVKRTLLAMERGEDTAAGS